MFRLVYRNLPLSNFIFRFHPRQHSFALVWSLRRVEQGSHNMGNAAHEIELSSSCRPYYSSICIMNINPLTLTFDFGL